MEESRTRTVDGIEVLIRTEGEGPGVVVLHGGGISSADYDRLARGLATRLTVHRYDRRGRPLSAPVSIDDTVATDISDLAVVLRHTGSTRVFGHSGGGFVALRAALELPIDRLALFDPAVALEGSRMPRGYIDELTAAADRGDTIEALRIVGAAADPDAPGARLPVPLQRLGVRLFLRTPIGRRMAASLPTMGPEIGRILATEAPATAYRGITAPTLLVTGTRSARYLVETSDALAEVIPDAHRVVIPRGGHNLANLAPSRLLAPLLDHLTADVPVDPGEP